MQNRLPVIDTRSIYTTHLPVMNKEVKFKPFTTGEEKKFIIAIEDKDDKALYINLQDLMKNCVVDCEIDFNTISLVDFMKLLFVLRAKSKSEAMTLKKMCPVDGCDTVSAIAIENIETTLKIKNLTKVKEIVKITDELSIELKPMDAAYMKDFLSVMKKDERSNKDILDLAISSVAYNISKIIYKDKIYTEWTPTEIKRNVIERLTDKQVKEITNGINKLVSMYFEVPFKCSKCEHEEVLLEENFFASL